MQIFQWRLLCVLCWSLFHTIANNQSFSIRRAIPKAVAHGCGPVQGFAGLRVRASRCISAFSGTAQRRLGSLTVQEASGSENFADRHLDALEEYLRVVCAHECRGTTAGLRPECECLGMRAHRRRAAAALAGLSADLKAAESALVPHLAQCLQRLVRLSPTSANCQGFTVAFSGAAPQYLATGRSIRVLLRLFISSRVTLQLGTRTTY